MLPSGIKAQDTIKPKEAANTSPISLLKPTALKQGAKVGIVAPASGLTQSGLAEAVSRVRGLGLVPITGDHLLHKDGYLSAPDAERAEEFMAFATRDDIDMLMCARGGYGTMRILPLLDFDKIRAHPKIIIGYSDITALINAIAEKSRIVTFHGPVADSQYTPFTKEYFWKVLGSTEKTEVASIPPYESRTALDVHSPDKLVRLGEGKASGILVGGNLTMVTSLLGTPYEIDTKDKIFFLEEVTEEPFHIDRMLTQLWLAGKLQSCAAIALGRFKNCEVHGSSPFADMSLSLSSVLRVRITSLKIPAVYGLPFGHVKDKLTVPIGVRATLDADNLKFTIDESGVS